MFFWPLPEQNDEYAHQYPKETNMLNSPLILLALFIFIGIQYLLEVHMGSPTCMYDAESGLLSPDCTPRKSSPGQFMGIAVPLQLAAIGLPILASNLLPGVLLILVSLFLFYLYGKKSSNQASINN